MPSTKALGEGDATSQRAPKVQNRSKISVNDPWHLTSKATPVPECLQFL